MRRTSLAALAIDATTCHGNELPASGSDAIWGQLFFNTSTADPSRKAAPLTNGLRAATSYNWQ